MSEPLQFDDVFLGADSAGYLLANRLSASPDQRVLRVQASGIDHCRWIHSPSAIP